MSAGLLPSQIDQVLGAKLVTLLGGIARLAAIDGQRLLLVGGAVRDVARGVRSVDIDLVVDRDGIRFLQFLFQQWHTEFQSPPSPESPVTFPHFGTGKLPFREDVAPGIRVIDVATVRQESYPVPGGKPTIRPGTIETDLWRRDFSINAMALQLAPDTAPELVDPCDGAADIAKRELRVLHEKSFVDDPARLLRAARLATRMGFSYESSTAELARHAVGAGVIRTLPPPRAFEEFKKVLIEENPFPVLRGLEEAGLLFQLHPLLSLGHRGSRVEPEGSIEQRFVALLGSTPAGTGWEERFAALVAHRTPDEIETLLRSFSAGKRLIQEITARSLSLR